MIANRITRTASIIGALSALAAVFYASDKGSGILILLAVFFAALNALPFILTYLLPFKPFVRGRAAWAFMLLTLGLLALSLAGYRQLFLDDVTDAQDGLLFAVLPVYQLAALGVGFLVIRICQNYCSARQ